jgi:hypothetical protein
VAVRVLRRGGDSEDDGVLVRLVLFAGDKSDSGGSGELVSSLRFLVLGGGDTVLRRLGDASSCGGDGEGLLVRGRSRRNFDEIRFEFVFFTLSHCDGVNAAVDVFNSRSDLLGDADESR